MALVQKRYLVIGAFFTIQVVISIICGLVFTAIPGENMIFPGVSINNWEVGGLSRQQALDFLKKKTSTNNSITMQLEGKSWSVPYAKLGIKIDFDRTVEQAMALGRKPKPLLAALHLFKISRTKPGIPLSFAIEETRLEQSLNGLAGEINVTAKNAYITEGGSGIQFVPEVVGRTLLVPETVQKIKEALLKAPLAPVDLVVVTKDPDVKGGHLEAVNKLLGVGITPFYGKGDWADSILSAVNALNGTYIAPGNKFSYNQVVGPRINNAIYRNSSHAEDSQLLRSMDSGISQVATTLYQALLYAGIKVSERFAHSSPPGYITTGMDAIVVYNRLDLKFTNTKGTPLYIQALVKDEKVLINIFGARKPGETIQVVSSVEQSSTGLKSTVTRIYYKNGVASAKETISVDNYTN